MRDIHIIFQSFQKFGSYGALEALLDLILSLESNYGIAVTRRFCWVLVC